MKSSRISISSQVTFYKTLLVVFLTDQFTKFIVTKYSEELQIVIFYNQGVSLGFLTTLRGTVLIFFLILLVVFLYWTYKSVWKEHQYAAGLFFGGALANIFDRVFFGAVRDWLYIPYTEIHNNIADIAIFLGLILLILQSYNLRSHGYK